MLQITHNNGWTIKDTDKNETVCFMGESAKERALSYIKKYMDNTVEIVSLNNDYLSEILQTQKRLNELVLRTLPKSTLFSGWSPYIEPAPTDCCGVITIQGKVWH